MCSVCAVCVHALCVCPALPSSLLRTDTAGIHTYTAHKHPQVDTLEECKEECRQRPSCSAIHMYPPPQEICNRCVYVHVAEVSPQQHVTYRPSTYNPPRNRRCIM